MNQYTIYCTAEQTKKALEFGAPIEVTKQLGPLVNRKYLSDLETYTAIIIPTAEQMIGWLDGQGINIAICICADGTYYNFYHKGLMKYYKTRKEATLAAIDVALDYLEKTTE